ncbi:MAG: hypothetical protein R8G34_10860 [Paracoccaceae bacterium]|nr:hypothetical protein [Paracoccaceae bacterium]
MKLSAGSTPKDQKSPIILSEWLTAAEHDDIERLVHKSCAVTLMTSHQESRQIHRRDFDMDDAADAMLKPRCMWLGIIAAKLWNQFLA